MSRYSSDHIYSAAECEAARQAAAERVKDIPDPRKEFVVKYSVNKTDFSENIFAYNVKDAEDIVRQQLSLLGMFPRNMVVVPA